MLHYLLLSLLVDAQNTNSTRPGAPSSNTKSDYDPLPLVLGLVAAALVLFGVLIYFLHYRYDATTLSAKTEDEEYGRKKLNFEKIFKFPRTEKEPQSIVYSPQLFSAQSSQVSDRQTSQLSILGRADSGPRVPEVTHVIRPKEPVRKMSILTDEPKAVAPTISATPSQQRVPSAEPSERMSILSKLTESPRLSVPKIFNKSPAISNASVGGKSSYSMQSVSNSVAAVLNAPRDSGTFKRIFIKGSNLNGGLSAKNEPVARKPAARKNSILTSTSVAAAEEAKPKEEVKVPPAPPVAAVNIDLGFTPYDDVEEDYSPFVTQAPPPKPVVAESKSGWKRRDSDSSDNMRRSPPNPSYKQAHKSNHLDISTMSTRDPLLKHRRSKSLSPVDEAATVLTYGRDENGYPIRKSPEKPKFAPPPPPLTFSTFMSQFNN